MARPLLVYADLHITHGDEVVRVKGHGERIEVSHSSSRFLLKALRRSFALDYAHLLDLDQTLRNLGLTVVLRTRYLCLTILGINARKWVRFAFRLILPS
jgi:hypothetical protein